MEKRDRGKNFSDREKEQLMLIAFKYKTIIENKKTDKINVRQKIETWEKILDEYNRTQTSGLRDVKQLKNLYDNLKMKARKEKIEDKRKIIATGGGSCSLTMTPLSNIIVSELADQYEPLPNPYDSRSSYYQEDIPILEASAPNMTDEEPGVDSIEIESSSVNNREDGVCSLQDFDTSKKNRKRKLSEVYGKLEEISASKNKKNSTKCNMLQKEHRLKMEILQLEKETAEINLLNARKKQKILDLKLEKLLG